MAERVVYCNVVMNLDEFQHLKQDTFHFDLKFYYWKIYKWSLASYHSVSVKF